MAGAVVVVAGSCVVVVLLSWAAATAAPSGTAAATNRTERRSLAHESGESTGCHPGRRSQAGGPAGAPGTSRWSARRSVRRCERGAVAGGSARRGPGPPGGARGASRRRPSSRATVERIDPVQPAAPRRRRGLRPAGPGRARPATGSRRRGGCPARPPGTGRAAGPSAAPGCRPAPPGAGRRVIARASGPRRADVGVELHPAEPAGVVDDGAQRRRRSRSPKRSHAGRSTRRLPYSSSSIGRVAVDHEPAGHPEAEPERSGPSVSSSSSLPMRPRAGDRAAPRARSRDLGGSRPPLRNQASGATTSRDARPTARSAEPPVELDLDHLGHAHYLPPP